MLNILMLNFSFINEGEIKLNVLWLWFCIFVGICPRAERAKPRINLKSCLF